MPATSTFPRGAIDVVAYHVELSLVRSWLESPPDDSLEDSRLKKANFVFCRRRNIERIAPRRMENPSRIAVAAGQYLLWCHAKQMVPHHGADFLESQPFHDLFDLHWYLLRRRLTLDAATATDLIKVDIAGRGDTEPRHALVALLERNFASTAPVTLQPILRDWADELSIHSSANFRKLAKRIWTLSETAT
jgi:hypothetical protein